MMPEAQVPGFRPGRAPRKLVEQRFRNYAVLVAKPRTGRTHQIRVHALAQGLPLVGDKHYPHPGALKDPSPSPSTKIGLVSTRGALDASYWGSPRGRFWIRRRIMSRICSSS